MHMLNHAVDQLTVPRTGARSDGAGRRRDTNRGPETNRNIPKSFATRFIGCVRRRVDSFCLSCCCGLTVLAGGVTCLIMYICSAARYSSLLMPGLAMFIVGVTATAVSEWYFRAKLSRRRDQVFYNPAMRQEIIDRISDAAARRCVSHLQDLPPSYAALYRTQRTLPVADVYGVSRARNFDSSSADSADEDRPTADHDAAPPSYSEVV